MCLALMTMLQAAAMCRCLGFSAVPSFAVAQGRAAAEVQANGAEAQAANYASMRLAQVTTLLATAACRRPLSPPARGPALQRPRHELPLRPGPTVQRLRQPACSRRCRACRVGAHLPA